MHGAQKVAIKVAIVTGAASGIGRAIAGQLHADGFAVVVNDLSAQGAATVAAGLQQAAGAAMAMAVAGDVSEPGFAEHLVQQAVSELGAVDVMVANAGINIVKPLLETLPADLQQLFAVNVFGVLYCMQAAARAMIAQGRGGKIISAASAAGKRGYPYLGAYSATKFSVVSLTQTAAQELAPHGITANAYCPGIVDTPMWTYIDGAVGAMTGAAQGETFKERISRIPLGRAAQPDDVARLVSFLASEKSDYMTGQSLVVDGGVVLS